MLNELNFVMNYVFLLNLSIHFRLATSRIRIFRYPELSDKLLKRECDTRLAAFTVAGGVHLLLFESNALFFAFSPRLLNEAFLTRRPVCRCSVSVIWRIIGSYCSGKGLNAKKLNRSLFQTTFEPKAYFSRGFKQKRVRQGPVLFKL